MVSSKILAEISPCTLIYPRPVQVILMDKIFMLAIENSLFVVSFI